MRRRLAPILFCLAVAAGPARAEPPAAWVTRHFPATGVEADSALTPAGLACAERLAERFAGGGLTAIYVTATRRSRESAEPLAARLRLPLTEYDPTDPEALVRRARAAGGAVLVVGHSNTVGELVTRFGGSPAPVLTSKDFGSLWRVADDGLLHERLPDCPG